jgi:predicted Fe-S protein YdhL (DUF1289 family)
VQGYPCRRMRVSGDYYVLVKQGICHDKMRLINIKTPCRSSSHYITASHQYRQGSRRGPARQQLSTWVLAGSSCERRPGEAVKAHGCRRQYNRILNWGSVWSEARRGMKRACKHPSKKAFHQLELPTCRMATAPVLDQQKPPAKMDTCGR